MSGVTRTYNHRIFKLERTLEITLSGSLMLPIMGLRTRDSWIAMPRSSAQSYRQDKSHDSQAKALSTSPPSSQGNVHRPKMQGFSPFSRAGSQALYCWHLLWRISVTTKGYTINTRWQILKLACFHNCHFKRWMTFLWFFIKTSDFIPLNIPTLPPTITCYENVIILFWRGWSSCASFVMTMFSERKKIMEAKGGNTFTDQSWVQSVPGKNKVENTVSNPMSKIESPTSVASFRSRIERYVLLSLFKEVYPTALCLMHP